MITDFHYVVRAMADEAELLRDFADHFEAIGMSGPADRMMKSVHRLEKLAAWTNNKIGEEVEEIVKHEAEQWNGLTSTILDAIRAK
jgi:hypothetical protein